MLGPRPDGIGVASLGLQADATHKGVIEYNIAGGMDGLGIGSFNGYINGVDGGWIDNPPYGIFITRDNNVGMGRTNPQAKLDVAGGVRIGKAGTCGNSTAGCTANTAGTMRYCNAKVEYCNSAKWLSLAEPNTTKACGATIYQYGIYSEWHDEISVPSDWTKQDCIDYQKRWIQGVYADLEYQIYLYCYFNSVQSNGRKYSIGLIDEKKAPGGGRAQPDYLAVDGVPNPNCGW